MAEPIASLAQAQDAIDQLGRDSVTPDARRDLANALGAYLVQAEGRQVMQQLLMRVVGLLERIGEALVRVLSRLDATDPMLTRLRELLDEEVTSRQRIEALEEAETRNGSRLLVILSSKPALMFYTALGTALTTWLVGSQASGVGP